MALYISMYRQSQYKTYAEAAKVGGTYDLYLPPEIEDHHTFAHPAIAQALTACRATANCLGETNLVYLLLDTHEGLLDLTCD